MNLPVYLLEVEDLDGSPPRRSWLGAYKQVARAASSSCKFTSKLLSTEVSFQDKLTGLLGKSLHESLQKKLR